MLSKVVYTILLFVCQQLPEALIIYLFIISFPSKALFWVYASFCSSLIEKKLRGGEA